MKKLIMVLLCVLLAGATSHAAPVSLLGEKVTERYNFNAGNTENRKEIVSVNHPAFDQAIRVTVAQKPAAVHQTSLSLSNASPLKKGDVIAVAFYGRAVEPTTSGTVQLFVQGPPDWGNPFVQMQAQLSSAWKLYSTQFTAREDRDANTLYFNIFSGQQEQIVDIGGIRVANFGADANADEVQQFLSPPSTRIADLPSYAQDFEGAFVPVIVTPKSPSSVTGTLPAGWTEDSSWQGANVKLKYEPIKRGAFAGQGALRITLDGVMAGRAQLRLDNIALRQSTAMKLRIALRSPTSSQMRLGIRNATKFNDYWTQAVDASPEWGVREFIIPPIADDPNAQFVVYMDKPLVFEIDEFSLVPISADAIGAGQNFDGNLLPNSSFPAGLPKPWVGTAEGVAENNFRSDAKVLGPTGLSALRVVTPRVSGRPMSQLTAPFLGKAGSEHTFSFFLKGARSGQQVFVRLGPPSANLWEAPYQKIISTTTEWQRYSWTVKLPFVAEGFYLARLTTHDVGEFWVDGVAVEAAAKAGEFKRASPVEVALLPSKNFGLHFENEPLSVAAVVYGDVRTGAVLRAKYFDVANKEFAVAPLTLKAGEKTQRREIVLKPAGELPFGTYRVEVTAHDSTGKAVSRLYETLLHRVRTPRRMNEFAPESPFGIHTSPTPEHVALAQALGYKWVRPLYYTGWNGIEVQPGQWDWTETDRLINLYQQHKLSILGVLSGVPRRHSLAPADFNGWNLGNAVVKPESLPAWSEYARRIAERYKGKITHWETWNEPDYPSFMFQDVKNKQYVHGAPEQFAAMTRAASQGLKAADPGIKVLWNSASTEGRNLDFIRGVQKTDIAQWIDGLTYHHYQTALFGFPGDPLQTRIATMKTIVPDGKTMPLWNTEGGPGPSELRSSYEHTPPLGLRSRADFWSDYVVRYYVSTLSSGVDKFFLYLYESGSWTPGYEMLNADASLAPNAVAVSNLAWHLEGKKFVKMAPLDKDIYAYVFEGGGDSVAITLAKGIGRIELKQRPATLEVHDIYGNDVKFPARVGNMAMFFTGKNMKADALLQKLLP